MAELTIAQRIKRIYSECSGVWGQSGVTDFERRCIEDWRGQLGLSEKQLAILVQIEKKVFPDEDE
jgi:hypothetical protein